MMGKARQGRRDKYPGGASFGTRSIAQSNCLIAKRTRNRVFDVGFHGDARRQRVTPDRSPVVRWRDASDSAKMQHPFGHDV